MPRIAVLCGTGMGDFSSSFSSLEGSSSEKMLAESPWGEVPMTIVSLPNGQVFVIDRHHSSNENRTPPHSIEHRANVHAAASCSPNLVVSINSVGSMLESMPPGKIGVASGILDLSIRPWSFHDEDAVHSDRTSPFDADASAKCRHALDEKQGDSPERIVVAQCVGPQFESPEEIDALEILGAHVVGMTLGPEQRLVSETGTPHISLVCSSNWASGRTPGDAKAHIDHNSVDENASEMQNLVAHCIFTLIEGNN